MKLWRKNKDIVIHCYTDRADVYNYFPVVPNRKTKPEWFKKLNTPYFKNLDDFEFNLKLCPGFTGLFNAGFTIPLWSDLLLEVGKQGSEDYRWQYSDGISNISFHTDREYSDYFRAIDYQHFKLESPWLFHCEERINFLAVEPFWQFKNLKNISVLPGMVQFYSQPFTNINLFVKREKNEQKTLLSAGTPAYTFIPITEKTVKIVCHLVSSEKIKNLSSISRRSKFFNFHSENLSLNKKRGCPYKFDVEE
jgi:hypothetical protein